MEVGVGDALSTVVQYQNIRCFILLTSHSHLCYTARPILLFYCNRVNEILLRLLPYIITAIVNLPFPSHPEIKSERADARARYALLSLLGFCVAHPLTTCSQA